MEVESAFEALGLAGPVPQAALKRAYLKAVRKHPPERDPEGFRRVRDAFEWLEARPWLCAAEDVAEAPAEPVEVRAEPVEARAEPVEAPAEPVPPPPEAAVPVTEVESALEKEPELVLPDLDFGALVEPIDRAALVELGNGVLAALAPARSLNAHLPPPYLVVHLVLHLIEQNEPDLASDLIEAFQGALDEQRYPLRALHSELVAVWQLVREVEDLREEVPEKLRRKLARGIREGNFEAAISAFERASDTHGSGLHVTVQREAPLLYAALWPRPERAIAGSESKTNYFGFVFGWRWLWLILFLARCAFSNSDRPSRSTYTEPPRPVVTPAPVVAASPMTESPPAPPPPADGELTNLQRDLVERSIDEAIERHDCATLFEQWPLYGGAFTARDEKRRAALAACPELAPTLK